MRASICLGFVGLALITVSAWCEEKRTVSSDKSDARVFELRTYHAHPGKMKALHARFRDHTCKLFEKHGITIVGFWSPIDPKETEDTLIYMLAYPSKAAADKSWAAFRADPDWIAAKNASEKDGSLVKKVESVFLSGTDYSPIK
jgi:NIPSNAP